MAAGILDKNLPRYRIEREGSMTDNAEPARRIPTGPFYGKGAPQDGLVMFGQGHFMVVLDAESKLAGSATTLPFPFSHEVGPAQLFRLRIGKVDLPGAYLCYCREFIWLGDAEEEPPLTLS